MSDESSFDAHHHAHVVVHPVKADEMTGPFRRVDILGEYAGNAYELADVAEFCRRAGLEELDLDADTMVEWQGGGCDTWE